jgi:hypothetical protein
MIVVMRIITTLNEPFVSKHLLLALSYSLLKCHRSGRPVRRIYAMQSRPQGQSAGEAIGARDASRRFTRPPKHEQNS